MADEEASKGADLDLLSRELFGKRSGSPTSPDHFHVSQIAADSAFPSTVQMDGGGKFTRWDIRKTIPGSGFELKIERALAGSEG